MSHRNVYTFFCPAKIILNIMCPQEKRYRGKPERVEEPFALPSNTYVSLLNKILVTRSLPSGESRITQEQHLKNGLLTKSLISS